MTVTGLRAPAQRSQDSKLADRKGTASDGIYLAGAGAALLLAIWRMPVFAAGCETGSIVKLLLLLFPDGSAQRLTRVAGQVSCPQTSCHMGVLKFTGSTYCGLEIFWAHNVYQGSNDPQGA